jgi:Domain of unknown function (DUF6794)
VKGRVENRPFIFLLVGLLLLISCAAVQKRSGADETAHLTKDIYIPRDLDDCFAQLKQLLEPVDIEKMKSGTENDMIEYHFTLGLWMRNNWGLWGSSRLAKWFNAQGVEHPDDMSGIILNSFWRHLNGKPIRLEEQVKYYLEYWKRRKKGSANVSDK